MRKYVGVAMATLFVFVLGMVTHSAMATPVVPTSPVVTTSVAAQPQAVAATKLTIPVNTPIVATNEEQRRMFSQFRLATDAEARVLQGLPDADSAYEHIYVALENFNLVRVDTPMVLIVPTHFKWLSGPMGLITFVRTPTTQLNDLEKNGIIFSEPLCAMQRMGVLAGDCYDPKLQTPGTSSEMRNNTRPATEAELKLWQGSDYVSGQVNHYRVVIRNTRIAPQYVFDGKDSFNGVHSLYVLPGVKILGGQLGFLDVYAPSNPMQAAMDSICFFAFPHTYDVGRADNFAPANELRRVQKCANR